jgi:hypothetical protein
MSHVNHLSVSTKKSLGGAVSNMDIETILTFEMEATQV